MESYKVKFRVQGYVRLNMIGSLFDNVVVEEYQGADYDCTVTVSAERYEDAVERAGGILNRVLDVLTTIARAPIRINPYVSVSATDTKGQTVHGMAVRMVDEIPKQEAKEFLQSLDKITKLVSVDSNKYLFVAMDFYNRSMWEIYRPDKVIDAFVAFEALYTKENEIGELSYMLSHRVATLLADTDEKRSDIFGNMRILYNRKRSKVVHGKDPELNDDDIKITYKYLADSLQRFVMLASLGHSQSQIIDMLDDALVNEKKRKEIRSESTPTFWTLKKVMM